MKYRMKPVVLEAVQNLGPAYDIVTPEGPMRCETGDWEITGAKGEKYPCKPNIFMQLCDPVGEETP